MGFVDILEGWECIEILSGLFVVYFFVVGVGVKKKKKYLIF